MFGERLKQLRKEHNMLQKDVADLLNVSPSTIGMYERNQRDPDTVTLQFIAKHFDVSVDYLLGRTNKRNYDTSTLAFSVDPRIDTEGLSDEDIAIVQATIDAIRKNRKKND